MYAKTLIVYNLVFINRFSIIKLEVKTKYILKQYLIISLQTGYVSSSLIGQLLLKNWSRMIKI